MTTHELARELLTKADIPVYHFDPSQAGMDDEDDTSISAPLLELVASEPMENPDTGEKMMSDPFFTICGSNDHVLAVEATNEATALRERDGFKLAYGILHDAIAKIRKDFNDMHLRREIDEANLAADTAIKE